MNLLPEIIIDSFAGGGGASEGIEMAMRRMEALGLLPEGVEPIVNFAINHDRKALAMHAANHPRTVHLPCDIWTADPIAVCGNNPVGLLWASPDCRHHSKAKGGKPVSESVRGLANVVVNWAELVQPRIIMLENVEEFQDWGPLIIGPDGNMRPDPARKGEYFKRWVRGFEKLGYEVDWRISRACDRGAPTIRKRLFVIMRRDGEPILWAPQSHAAPDSNYVKNGSCKPWRTAAEIIDFDLPCPSVLMSKVEGKAYTGETGKKVIRPLAENTERRIAKGIKRYVLDDPEPFVVTCNHSGDGFRGQGLDEPFATITRARDGHGFVVPYFVPRYQERFGQSPRTRDVQRPAATVVPGGNTGNLATAVLAPFLTYGQHGGASRSGVSPAHTITASKKDTNGVAVAFLAQHNTGVIGRDLNDPFPTAPTIPQQSLVAAHMLSLKGSTRREYSAEDPHAAVTAGGQHSAVVSLPLLNAYYGADEHGAGLKSPCRTVSTKDRFGVVDCPVLVPPMTPEQTVSAQKVADFLRRYECWDSREFVTVMVRGAEMVIVDIGMRMLTPRELARAQGFKDSYKLDAQYLDPATRRLKRLTETDQRHKIGNSVCPDEAEAHVFANYRPQLCAPVERAGWMLADGWNLQPMEAAE